MGYRLIGVTADAESSAGGSNYDRLTDPGPLAYPVPSDFFPVTSASAEPGYEDRERNDEVRGRRATTAPYPWRAKPTCTFSVRVYPQIARWLFPRLTGGRATTRGVAPAPVTTLFAPVNYGGLLPSSNIVLVRDDQIDYFWGAWVEQAEIEVSAENEVTATVTARALYHQSVPLAATTFDPVTSNYLDPYSGMTLKVSTGRLGELSAIDCVSSWGFTFSNTLSDDDDVLFCKGRNVVKQLVDGNRYRYRQYVDRHRVGRQDIRGRVQFGSTQPSWEERRLLTTTEALVAELTGNPLGTTPEADDLVRFTFHAVALTGGGADDLSDDGEIKSAYEWSSHLDLASGKDFEVEFVGRSSVPAP